MMVDEADIDLIGGSSPHHKGSKRISGDPVGSPRPPNKRKPGPIPKDVLVRRPSPSPLPSPAPSPAPLPSPLPPPSISPPPSLSPPPPPPTQLLPLLPPALLPAVNGEIEDSIGNLILDSPRSPSPPPRDMPPPVLQPYDGLPNHITDCASSIPPPSLIPINASPPPLLPNTHYSPPSSPRTIPNLSSSLEEGLLDLHSNHLTANIMNHLPQFGNNNIINHNEIANKERSEIKRHNTGVRKLAYKEVRRPGKNYAPLFEHLDSMKGSVEDKVKLLKDIINECLRFKRKKLAKKVEDILHSIITSSHYRTTNNGTT